LSHITGSPQATTQATQVAPPGPDYTDDINRLNADFKPWHCWLSHGDKHNEPRVIATRCRSRTGPDRRGDWAPSGITLDARTPAEMRDLLTRRTP
jgi:hypothetical protein